MADFDQLADELEGALHAPYSPGRFTDTCGAALAIIKTHPEEVLRLAHSRLYAYPFKDVPECWRRLYCEASLWLAQAQLCKLRGLEVADAIAEDKIITELVRVLDLALIMTGAPYRSVLVRKIMNQVSNLVEGSQEPCHKRRRICRDRAEYQISEVIDAFSEVSKSVIPPTTKPIARTNNLSLTAFQSLLLKSHAENGHNGPLPVIITNSISAWPAMSTNAWVNPQYLLAQTIGGRRVIPVEVGKSYTDDAWGQKLQTMRDFMKDNMMTSHVPAEKRGYLAQHDLFVQIPGLKDDIVIPDYCYSEPPKRPSGLDGCSEDDHNSHDEVGSDEEVVINAWFGPAHTVSPAHTDPHHNILAQVVGHKYVRLFAPTETAKMYARSQENGINMSNTSQVDIAEAMRLYEGWQGWVDHGNDLDVAETLQSFRADFPEFPKAQYLDGVLGPGDCLYIPEGWWHYVRSLSPSFSVSFWWD